MVVLGAKLTHHDTGAAVIADEAMACFLATEMDYLILEDRLITKRRA